MGKKTLLLGLVVFVLIMGLSGCVKEKEINQQELSEEYANVEFSEATEARVSRVDKIYTFILFTTYIIIIVSGVFIVKNLLIAFDFKTAHINIIIVLINVAAIHFAIGTFSYINTASWYLHETGKELTSITEIVSSNIVAVIIIVLSVILRKVLEKISKHKLKNSGEEGVKSSWDKFMEKHK
ncbi:hypothetical protein [Dethiothermospora halolimnae]|uniref:hypothetical protein n=1 Tax=Dethiothermospora halolimnae TaxID=3114390 RepID=UPI003CCB9FBB